MTTFHPSINFSTFGKNCFTDHVRPLCPQCALLRLDTTGRLGGIRRVSMRASGIEAIGRVEADGCLSDLGVVLLVETVLLPLRGRQCKRQGRRARGVC